MLAENARIAVLGAGNLGTAIANGLAQSGRFARERIILTRRRHHLLDPMREVGYIVEPDNTKAVQAADVILVAVEPQQIDPVLREIRPFLEPGRHTVISVVTGVPIARIEEAVGTGIPVVRAMPNTAVAVREAVTCVASTQGGDAAVQATAAIFQTVGTVEFITEEDMNAATALGACVVAFFVRAIRAASPGGLEIGFSAPQALAIAAQTARGAATLLLHSGSHPEHEIDRVTTPRGCTITGLNQMEHEGFSSALIKGITVAAAEASRLYRRNAQATPGSKTD